MSNSEAISDSMRAALIAFCLLTASAAAGDIGSLLDDLGSGDAKVRAAAAKKLSQEKELPVDAVQPVAMYIRTAIVTTSEPVSEPAPRIEGEIDRVPLIGDETPLVRVKASPRDFLGKDIVITCAAKLSDYYNFEYSESGTVLNSLQCTPVDELRRSGGEYCHVYANRKACKTFVDAVTASEERGSPIICRLKLTINPKRHQDVLADSWNMFELRRWQFLNADKKTWTDWQPTQPPKQEDYIKELLARLPDTAAPAMAAVCVRSPYDAPTREIYDRLLQMPKSVRKSAADHVRKLGYKSTDKAFKKKVPVFAKNLELGRPL